MIESRYTQNPSYKYGNDTQQICADVFNKLNLNMFSYSKIFPDGSRAELWSDIEAMEYSFFTKKYLRGVYTPSLIQDRCYLLYELEVENFPIEIKKRLTQQLVDQKGLFNHNNCFFVVKHNLLYTEYFVFYTPRENITAVNNYFNNIEEIANFCEYFRDTAKLLIKQCEKSPLILPWKEPEERLGNDEKEKTIDRNNGLNSFLTPREKQLAKLLSKGLTAKEISRLLYVTKKTVDKHTENIKKKLGCQRKSHLIACLNLESR